MTNNKQSGFSAVEAVVILLILALIAAAGYAVVHRSAGKVSNVYKNSASQASVPAVNNTSDLTSASKSLDQTNVDDSQLDTSQLDSELNNF